MTKKNEDPREVSRRRTEAELTRVVQVGPDIYRTESVPDPDAVAAEAHEAAIAEASEQAAEQARHEFHDRWNRLARERWRRVFKNVGMPFKPESVERDDFPLIREAIDGLPGWRELIGLRGALRFPYAPSWDLQQHYNPEVRKRRREAIRRGEEVDKPVPVLQAERILGMCNQIRLFAELWEPLATEILEWFEKDEKRAQKKLPPTVEAELRDAREQRQRWAEAQKPKTEKAPHPGMAERDPTGESVQKLRPIRERVDEDGAIVIEPDIERTDDALEREAREKHEKWLSDALGE